MIKNNANIIGVAVSEKDPYHKQIRKLAVTNGIKCLTQDQEPLFAERGFIIGWPHILKSYVIESFDEGVLNIHFGPLPYYRGSGCLEHALHHKKDKFGVSLHFIDGGVDTGPLIDVYWTSIKQLSFDKALDKLVNLAYKMSRVYMPVIEGRLPPSRIYYQRELTRVLGIDPIVCTREKTKKLTP